MLTSSSGDDVKAAFEHAQLNKYAIPAINVTSSSVVVAALEAARDSKSPIILQLSQGGAAFFGGKGAPNGKQEASIAGAVAGAHYIRSIAPLYGIPVVLHTDHCAKKLLPCLAIPHPVFLYILIGLLGLDGMMDHDEAYFKQHGEPLVNKNPGYLFSTPKTSLK